MKHFDVTKHSNITSMLSQAEALEAGTYRQARAGSRREYKDLAHSHHTSPSARGCLSVPKVARAGGCKKAPPPSGLVGGSRFGSLCLRLDSNRHNKQLGERYLVQRLS